MWAATETLNVEGLTDKAAVVNLINNGWTSGNITISFSKNNSSTGGSHFEGNDTEAGGVKNIKWRYADGKSTMTITSAEGFLVTQVKLYMYEVQYGITTTPTSTRTSGTDGSYKTETFDISENTQTVALLKSQSYNNHILKIEVTYAADNRTDFGTFRLNRDEALYSSPDLFVGRQNFNKEDSDPFEFLFDSSKTTLKTKVNLTDGVSLSSYNATSDNFTIESSDPTVINVSNSTISEASAGRLYFDNMQVLKAGTTTLTYKFLGSSSHKKAEFSVTVNVKEHLTTFDNSYPYTWDFNNGDWSTSMIWMDYYASTGTSWTTTKTDGATEARPTSNSFVGDDNVDIIKGLTFNVNNTAGSLCLDWFTGRQSIWMANGTSFTIPNVPAGYIVKIKADGTSFTGSSNCIKNNNTLTVNTTGDVTVTMTADTRIFSIYAGPELKATWSYTPNLETIAGDTKERATSGTFTFTGEGKLTGGTIIDEVPGITMTVGTSGTNYMVENHSQIGYAPGCIEYIFTPTVNGYLTVNMYSANSHTYIRENGNEFIDISATASNNIYNGDYTTPNDKPLKAGNTYRLHVKTDGAYNPIYLHSFTFRPAFLNPTTKTDQLTVGKFTAHVNDPAISAFPKLIDPNSEAQQNRVKFAGDRTMVYLYKNNDVEIIGTGTDVLIRGTVLDKNNEDGLVAYYYLDSYVLNLVSSELEDQAYIDADGLGDNIYTFTFSGDIASAADASVSTVMVNVKTDNGAEENVGANISGATLNINFGNLSSAEGSTYRITIPANVLALKSDATTKNSEIVRTFSVNKEGELQIKMIYPTDIATVGTSIVFATYVPDLKDSDHSNFYLNDNKKVKVVISAAGEEDMEVEGTFNKNQLAFKPTRTLSHNKTYSVTYLYNTPSNVITSNEVTNMSDVKKIYQVTKNKEFTFITGSSSGTQPQVVDNGTIPSENAEIPGSAYSSGRISFTFDQNVELEPYSTVTVTPVNGSESTTTATTSAPGSENNTLKIDSDGKTVYFEYGEDGLKYDLYYEVIIPANTVVGAGGLTNHEDIKLHFKMGQKPNSACKITTGTAFDGYPYSWDFQKFGNLTTTITDLTINAPDPTTGSSEEKAANKATATASRWQYSNSNSRFGNYFTNGMKYPQGEVATYYTTKNETPEDVEIAEMRGLRWSLAKMNTTAANNRIQIGGNTGPVQIVGGVHYLTIPNVPAGKKIYIKARVNDGNSSSLFNINSNNATFSEGYASESEKQIGIRTGSEQIYVVDVTDSGYDSNDVTFCLHDVTFYKIAVAADTKTFKPSYKNGNGDKTYATDRVFYDVRYDLLNEFTDHNVKAYYITGITDNPGVNSADITATQVPLANAAKADEGVLVVYQGGVDANTEVPIFKADVNTESGVVSNLFKVIDKGSTLFPTADSGYYNYVLSSGGSKSTGVGFYRYTGTTFSDRAAYLPILISYVNTNGGNTLARKTRLLLIDDDESVTTDIIEVATEKTPNNDGYFYNLNGMRVEHPKAGIYIRNGKKVVMK